jgi:hypothetical protein
MDCYGHVLYHQFKTIIEENLEKKLHSTNKSKTQIFFQELSLNYRLALN